MAAVVFATLTAVAAVGGLASVLAHLASFAGLSLPERLFFPLHAGIFVVWGPFVLSGLILRWRGVEVAGWPSWFHSAFRWSFGYAAVHFAVAVGVLLSGALPPEASQATPPVLIRFFSAFWFLFYATATVGHFTFWRTVASGSGRA